MTTSVTIGVSACLMGDELRYDGGHKRDSYVSDVLSRYFRVVTVCPEVESGMTVPREPMSLRGDPAHPRLVGNQSAVDRTAQMLEFTGKKVQELAAQELCGFIFKSRSPSCGVHRVPVFGEAGSMSGVGSGLFSSAVARAFPHLPVEEEGRLLDTAIRENFIERVFAYRRWRDFLQDRPDLGKLVHFHSRNKLVMMSHSPSVYRQIGSLVAHGCELEFQELLLRYEALFMRGLELHATVRKQTNVLQHVMGYFKTKLDRSEKEELLQAIERYHAGLAPLIVPLTLLNHYVARHDQQYLKQQWYLLPDPAETMLRNHA